MKKSNPYSSGSSTLLGSFHREVLSRLLGMGEKTQSYSAVNPTNFNSEYHGKICPWILVYSGINIIEITSYFLIEFNALSTEELLQYDYEIRAWELKEPRSEPISIILLN